MNRFIYEYRVRYRDTDKMGVSYYGSYLDWFEAARAEHLRALGYPYSEWEKKGYFHPAVEVKIIYLGPTAYDDCLAIHTWVSQVKKTSFRFDYLVYKKLTATLVTRAYSVHVVVNHFFKPVSIPAKLKKQLISPCFFPSSPH